MLCINHMYDTNRYLICRCWEFQLSYFTKKCYCPCAPLKPLSMKRFHNSNEFFLRYQETQNLPPTTILLNPFLWNKCSVLQTDRIQWNSYRTPRKNKSFKILDNVYTTQYNIASGGLYLRCIRRKFVRHRRRHDRKLLSRAQWAQIRKCEC